VRYSCEQSVNRQISRCRLILRHRHAAECAGSCTTLPNSINSAVPAGRRGASPELNNARGWSGPLD